MTRVITLADGRRVPLRLYVRAWRDTAALARLEPQATVCGGPGDASRHGRQPVAHALRDFRRGLHDRINRHAPGYGAGRKWSPDWQRACIHTAQLVSNPRVRVSWVPHDLRARLEHRIG